MGDENLAWCHQFVLSFDQQRSPLAPASAVRSRMLKIDDPAERHGLSHRAGAEGIGEKQGGDVIGGAAALSFLAAIAGIWQPTSGKAAFASADART